jgi:hypothetical protein
MTVSIVDLLQIVLVDQQDGEWLTVAVCPETYPLKD